MFFNTLTPKFYVALTATSSLISGLILVNRIFSYSFLFNGRFIELKFSIVTKIFEWWYFKKYGTSFIEQVSLNYISANANEVSNGVSNGSPSIEPSSDSGASQMNSSATNSITISNNTNSTSHSNNSNNICLNNCNSSSNNSTNNNNNNSSVPECKVWKNPMSLFRGAEYSKLMISNGKEPLTFYDMNLSAQDHQTFFTCDSDEGKADYEIMQRAWRERNPTTRINLANEALTNNSE
jgi:hypothetical protein